jgi:hypothetical protein
MVNGALYLAAASLDLGLEQRDPLLELLDGEWIEVLPRQRCGGIVLSTRKILVGVHQGQR